ncbi:ER membrane protein complex subunit 10 [Cephus cinctus]|uniref:ER membrane protein complex subunit 10 n=1 Tax=Cephus cinctus TaxID=211228 RepID=A0AAJ7C9X7_CEPCN|nr:ER membrane protein complex subunit 10 [Cephus cinctus]
MYLLYVSACVLLSSNLLGAASELDYDGWLHIRLFHALNDDPVPQYVERGNITVSSVRSGASTIGQHGLQPSQITQLKYLAEKDSKYRLKAIIRSASGGENTFLTSLPACYLLGSDLEDILVIWIDSAAEPVAVNLLSPTGCTLDNPFAKMWSTSVQVKYPESGPVPDTASYIQKLEREREARERGETKDNRSFLAKYWMYIVPAVIFVVLTSATNPEAAGGGGGGGQRQ